jgi:anaerobic selenocysteine-containing dehydrogenase
MSRNSWSRRTFLKAMGLGGAGSALLLSGCGDTDIINEVDLEVRKEKIEPNVDPQDFVQPGVDLYYSSTCRMCPAGCNLHTRIREARVLKLEGNPDSPVNHGRLCPMGQAGLHAHYNPDRLTKPMIRKNGSLVEVSWDEGMDTLKEKLAKKNSKLAWLNGAVSGHHAALIKAYLDEAGSKNMFVFDTLPPAVGHAANEAMFGAAMPRLDFKKAKVILSFGADFLGTWMSPVQFATQYAEFRLPPRGTLVMVESKMTLTGANADRWVGIRPGTEGYLAMALASLLVQDPEYAKRLPKDILAEISKVDHDQMAKITGVSGDRMHNLHNLLTNNSPSLVLSGSSAEGVEYGSQTARAVLLLNVILGNVGETILPRAEAVFPDLMPKMGGWAQMKAFLDGLNSGAFDTAVVFGTNPLYQAPDFMHADKAYAKAGYRIAFSMFPDETAMASDLVLPLHSYLEEWNTALPAYSPEDGFIGLLQPVMNPVFGEGTTRPFGDLMLAVVQEMNPKYKAWKDYEAYVRDAVWAMRGVMVKVPTPTVGGETDREAFHEGTLSDGFIRLKTKPASAIKPKLEAVNLPEAPKANAQYPFRLLPTPRLGLWDGRHANLPWLQELPDQLAEVVWDSWVELHPSTAEKLGGIETGDVLRVSSASGSVEVKAVVTPAIHPDCVAIPLGQGHTEYGRYAKGIGVNPYHILDAKFDAKTGELATFATDVQVAKVSDRGPIVTLAHGDLVLENGSNSQAGREIVKTVTAEQFNRTEEA